MTLIAPHSQPSHLPGLATGSPASRVLEPGFFATQAPGFAGLLAARDDAAFSATPDGSAPLDATRFIDGSLFGTASKLPGLAKTRMAAAETAPDDTEPAADQAEQTKSVTNAVGGTVQHGASVVNTPSAGSTSSELAPQPTSAGAVSVPENVVATIDATGPDEAALTTGEEKAASSTAPSIAGAMALIPADAPRTAAPMEGVAKSQTGRLGTGMAERAIQTAELSPINLSLAARPAQPTVELSLRVGALASGQEATLVQGLRATARQSGRTIARLTLNGARRGGQEED